MTNIMFTGRDGVATYRAIVLKHAIQLYAKTKIKPNRAYTPTNMLQTATQITGVPLGRGQYVEAIIALEHWIRTNGTRGD